MACCFDTPNSVRRSISAGANLLPEGGWGGRCCCCCVEEVFEGPAPAAFEPEPDGPAAADDDESPPAGLTAPVFAPTSMPFGPGTGVLFEVDLGLVAFEHVEAEQEVDGLALHDGEGAWHGGAADADFRVVDASEDLGCADAARDSREALVDEAHDAASFSASGRHDGCLRARVNERLDAVVVDFAVDVEHADAAKHWRNTLADPKLQIYTSKRPNMVGGVKRP
ncbi:hypothetical protein BKA81DRAFT_379269 [Phyllosticta paracitricarpa]